MKRKKLPPLFLVIFWMFLFPLFLMFISIFIWDYQMEQELAPEEARLKEVVTRSYEESGFKGQVLNFDLSQAVHSQVVSYEYVEETNKGELYYDIDFKSHYVSDKIKYSLEDIIALYTQTDSQPEGTTSLFSPFFDQVFLESDSLVDYRLKIEEDLKSKGFENLSVSMWSSIEFDYDAFFKKEEIKQKLKEDLDDLNRDGNVPLFGINQLDPFKYFQAGWTYILIHFDSIDDLNKKLKKLDQKIWKPGYYSFEAYGELEGQAYQLKENGEWVEVPKRVNESNEDSE